MSSMKDLVAGQCGTSNALVKASNHFTNDQAFRSMQRTQPDITAQGFVNEFVGNEQQQQQMMGQPNTFHMGSLLQELGNSNQAVHEPPPVLQARNKHFQHIPQANHEWAAEFKPEEFAVQHKAFPAAQQEHIQHQPSSSRMLPVYHGPYHQQPHNFYHPPMHHQPMYNSDMLRRQQIESRSRVSEESPSKQEARVHFKDEMKEKSNNAEDDKRAAAAKLHKQMKESEVLGQTGFAKYLADLAGVPDTAAPENKSPQKSDFDNFMATRGIAGEFPTGEQPPAMSQEYWDQFEKTWEQMVEGDQQEDASQLMEEPSLVDPHLDEDKNEYKFEADNPFSSMEDPFGEGLRRMKLGDLSNAVLLFEAAVQQKPERAEAWYYLGQTRAQNEQEESAILALKKSLELKPEDLMSQMALAVSEVNEHEQLQAVASLRKWLMLNPRYKHLISPDEAVDVNKRDPSSFFSFQIDQNPAYIQVREAFIDAARLSPDAPDADVQIALGLLFHLVNQYDKACDCFEVALQVRPDDAQLWNKLGATLANGQQSEKAVEAYRKALILNPGFIRSRYNLGISCMNLNAKREAMEHFITALDVQRSARGPGGEVGKMSETVWSTLRMCLSTMGEPEQAMEMARLKDIDGLMKHFNVHSTPSSSSGAGDPTNLPDDD